MGECKNIVIEYHLFY